MRCLRLVPFAALLAANCIHAESTPHEALLVLSKGDHTIAIVDPSTLKVVAKAPVGEDPHEVIASANGRFAYVSNYGGGRYNTLALIDLVHQKALPSIDLGPLRGPHGLDFVDGKVWFTAEGAKAIGRYDPATKKVDWILGTGQNRTHMVWVSQDLKRIYTTNVSSGTVSIIEKVNRPAPPPGRPPMGPPGGDWNETVVPVGAGSEGFDVTPDGRELWTADAQDGTVSVIDLAVKRVTDTLQANVKGANRLKFTPDGKLAFISSLSSPDLTILDVATHKEVKRLNLGHRGAAGILMQPDGSRGFVAVTGGNDVAVVDLKRLEVTGHIDAGPQPDGLAWSILR
ncbi:MAG TPA: YncE family protein [Bryobacteraceae bacterium]|nr:YncE family protein [Bryobacteraceae bacterium]